MTKLRLGAVGYLNARPLVFGLERSPRFDLRFDIPSRCAELLHQGAIDVGLIPSIEYLRDGTDSTEPRRRHGPSIHGAGGAGQYRIVPEVAIASRGPVASVLLHTTRPIADVRSVALDTSSRTSAALLHVLCARQFRIRPAFEPHGPDLASMLAHCDAALIIGDHALFPDPGRRPTHDGAVGETVDLGEVWTKMTGLPFVYAFWAGRDRALTPEDVGLLQDARDAGVKHPEEIARGYVSDSPERLTIGARYLRDNIQYRLGEDERAGLELFFRYAAEHGVVPSAGRLRFFEGQP